jgi:uncharacterized membrane protein
MLSPTWLIPAKGKLAGSSFGAPADRFVMIRLVHLGILNGLLSFVAVFQNFYYWQHLPPRVATHFGSKGLADGWMDRTQACLTMGLFQVLMPLLFLGLGYWMYWVPESWINLPNKAYWFHPDRKQESLASLARLMGFFSIAMGLFMLGINHLTFVANLGDGRLPMLYFWILMGLFLGFTTLWVGWMLIRFRVVVR